MDVFSKMELQIKREMDIKRIKVKHIVDDLHISRHKVNKALILEGDFLIFRKIYNYVNRTDMKEPIKRETKKRVKK